MALNKGLLKGIIKISILRNKAIIKSNLILRTFIKRIKEIKVVDNKDK